METTDIDINVEISDPQAAVMASRQQLTLDMAGQGGGKSQIIAYLTGSMIENFPQVKGFIGANTYLQLSQSTLTRIFETWTKLYGYTEYDAKGNPSGVYVLDKKPPMHYERLHRFKNYDNVISFWNGAVIFVGSLDNYKAHDGKEFGYAHLDETKDTEEAALTEVILGRLRQYGLWYDKTGEVIFCEKIPADMAKKYGWAVGEKLTDKHAEQLEWVAWNPLYIHTSPAQGGTPWLNRMFKLHNFEKEIKDKVLMKDMGFFYREFENKCVVIYSTHHNQKNLPPNYISNQEQNQTDETIMRLVYAYPFAKTGGECYPYFQRDRHVKTVTFDPGSPVAISLDFNVVPYMTLSCYQLQYVTKYLDEIGQKHLTPGPGLKPLEVMIIRKYKEYCLSSPFNTTEAICERFAQDHNPQVTEVDYYGDATGTHRIPGLGSMTNFKIVEECLHAFLHNNSKRVKDPNVGNFKRIDLLNRIFAGKVPNIEFEIDSSCEKTIEDYEDVKLGPKGKVKKRIKDEASGEKIEKVGHTSDTDEYFISEICKEFLN